METNIIMGKSMINPFESLPSRGTGLKTGNAGERKEGQPRTDEERGERHKIMSETKDDSVSIGTSKFVKVERDGKTDYRRKGYEDVELPPSKPREPQKKTENEQWIEYHAKK